MSLVLYPFIGRKDNFKGGMKFLCRIVVFVVVLVVLFVFVVAAVVVVVGNAVIEVIEKSICL